MRYLSLFTKNLSLPLCLKVKSTTEFAPPILLTRKRHKKLVPNIKKVARFQILIDEKNDNDSTATATAASKAVPLLLLPPIKVLNKNAFVM